MNTQYNCQKLLQLLMWRKLKKCFAAGSIIFFKLTYAYLYACMHVCMYVFISVYDTPTEMMSELKKN